jgi:hypothetical protein
MNIRFFVTALIPLSSIIYTHAISPTLPSNPTAVLTTYDDGARANVKITWTDNSRDETMFVLYRKEQGGSFAKIGTTTANHASYTDQLQATGTYSYAVTACRNEECSLNTYTNAVYYAYVVKTPLEELTKKLPKPLSFSTLFRPLAYGNSGDDVVVLQTFLQNHGYTKDSISTGYFGKKTKDAVSAFQVHYKNELLTPYGYTSGTGKVGTATMKKINELLARDAVSTSTMSSSTQP